MPNAELIRRTIKAMEEREGRWEQSDWVGVEDEGSAERPTVCNTTLCFAGFALVEQYGEEEFFAKATAFSGGGWWLTHWTTSDLEEEAQEALGLDDEQANRLFGSMVHDLTAYKALVTDVTGVAL